MSDPTHDLQGSRIARCPLCNRMIRLTSLPDDTRWRYEGHNATGYRAGRECDNSGELVATTKESP